jgi:LuxR family transcriptional regulator, maltose regulon positive regulatory protein
VGVPVLDSGATGSDGIRLVAHTSEGGAGRGHARGAQAPALVEAKLRPPAPKPDAVLRTALVKRLRQSDAGVVLALGPAGYGKTTLLAQWAAAESRPVAWLTCDVRDNDPAVLLAHVEGAIDRAVGGLTLRTLASSRDHLLLVLDGVDRLRTRESVTALTGVLDQLPGSATVALGSRSLPRVPPAALRARGDVEIVGTAELAFAGREAHLLLSAVGDLGADERAFVIDACEGWPAALALAALAARGRGTAATRPGALSGTDRFLADYIASEYLAPLRPADLQFLRRTAVLPTLSAAACDAILHDEGAKAALARIARANLFVLPVDGRPGCFRLHRLVRDLLLRELTDVEPRLLPVLHRRAAAWHEKRGELEQALEHADAAGDLDRVVRLVDALALPLASEGRIATVEGWLERFDERLLARNPILAVNACRVHALRGRAQEAERMLALAERGARRGGRGAATLRPRVLVMRAALCRSGPRRMLTDARAARARLPRGTPWHTAALKLEACAELLLGAQDEADARLGETAGAASAAGLEETLMVAVSQRSLLARERGEDDLADDLAAKALELAAEDRLAGYPTRALALAAAAAAALRQRRWGEARELLAAAEPPHLRLTEALPWLAVGARLELARGYLTLNDVDTARRLLEEAEELLEARPDLGVLAERARALRRDADRAADAATVDHFGLTPAELRLLPLLATHLSFREIAEELSVSRNTVKTQAISIYRRLGVSGRSEAILKVASTERSHAAA